MERTIRSVTGRQWNVIGIGWGAGGRVGHCTCRVRPSLAVPAPFVWRCLTSPTVPERQHPLIEPDVRFARIRLSDHLHRMADAGALGGAVIGNR